MKLSLVLFSSLHQASYSWTNFHHGKNKLQLPSSLSSSACLKMSSCCENGTCKSKKDETPPIPLNNDKEEARPFSFFANPLSSARDARIVSPAVAAVGASTLFASPETVYAESPDALSVRMNIEKYFPSVVEARSLPKLLDKMVPSWKKNNTLLATSHCSDEVNEPFLKIFSEKYGIPFMMGGLGGIPFVGTSGMGAAVSHIPDGGNLLIVISAHIGISPSERTIGKVYRKGRKGLSGACGAVTGALKLIKANPSAMNEAVNLGVENAQIDYLTKTLYSSMQGKKFSDDADEFVWATYQTYLIALQRLKAILKPLLASPSFSIENVAILGGVLVNVGPEGNDVFQPITFEIGGVDKFREAFGYPFRIGV